MLQTGRPVESPEAQYETSDKVFVISPGPGGAHTWQAASFSPDTGLVYFPVLEAGFAYKSAEQFSHEALATLTLKTWLARLSAPFELCSPQLTIPAIKAACESNKRGLALAATILLVAGHAVTVEKSASNLSQLQKLAGGTIEERAAPA